MLLPQILQIPDGTKRTNHRNQSVWIDESAVQKFRRDAFHFAVKIVRSFDLIEYPVFEDFPDAQSSPEKNVTAFDHNQVPNSQHGEVWQAIAEKRQKPLNCENLKA